MRVEVVMLCSVELREGGEKERGVKLGLRGEGEGDAGILRIVTCVCRSGVFNVG